MLQASSRCVVCGRPGQLIFYKDETERYCQTCFDKLKSCSSCGRRIREGHQNPGDAALYCWKCWEQMRICAACGRHIWKWTSFGQDDEEVFCSTCVADLPRCAACGSPAARKAVLLPDDRHICHRCHQTATYRADKAQDDYDEVYKILIWRLGLNLKTIPKLSIVRQDELSRIAQDVPGATKLLGLYSPQSQGAIIYIIIGLPANLFREVAAHELGHAWLSENAPHIADKELTEGFSEWLAYKVGQCLGDSRNLQLMKEKNGDYGRGLRRMLDLEKQGGVAAVMRMFGATV